MKKTKTKMLLFFVWILILVQAALSYPPFSTEFYGTVTYYNQPAPVGSIVRIYDTSSNQCGEFVTRTAGFYGLASCKGDDLSTTEIEGPSEGAQTIFYLDNQIASISGDNIAASGSFKIVNLIVPEIRCGDNFCDNSETCLTCELDCGACNATGGGNTTGNETSGGGGGGSGSGGSGGSGSTGGSSSDGTTSSDYPSFSAGDIFGYPTQGVEYSFSCDEDWSCGNWSECPVTEVQSRNCTDLNACGTFRSKPSEKKACVYGEELLKEESEKSKDDNKPPWIERPLEISFPKIVCEKETNPLNNGGIWLFLVMIIIVAFRIFRMEKEIEKINEKKELDDVKRAKLLLATKRRAYIFIGVMVFFIILLYMFYVFFFLCEINFTALWILIAVMLLLPLLIHKIINFLEYNEQKKVLKLEELADTHYQQINNLIKIESENIAEIEKEITERINSLSERESFRQNLKQYPELKSIYEELLKLYDEYRDNKTKFKDEEKLVGNIYDLSNKDEFEQASEKSPELKLIYDRLLLLYRHYEEKQALYEELAKAEEELRKRMKETELNKSNKNNKSNE
ncbi:MAG: hypothetical protein ABH828_03505 [archaeon]